MSRCETCHAHEGPNGCACPSPDVVAWATRAREVLRRVEHAEMGDDGPTVHFCPCCYKTFARKGRGFDVVHERDCAIAALLAETP